ncbi:MAG TPA: dihydroflavonol 4-reductase, partial [Clostridiales bacterium]|nr:dihydroflavonol 4-reductase [Clostridiales bacterium]
MSKVYLVTGAAGHLGSTIVRKLTEMGKKIRILILPDEKNLPEGNYELFHGDVCIKESLGDFFDNQSKDDFIVVHCAGIVSIASKYIQKVYDVNVTGTKNIVDLCIEHKVKKLVYVSSVHAIPEKKKGETITEVNQFNPDDVIGLYAKTKSEATGYVLSAVKNGLDASVVHPSGICGPYDNGRGHITTLVIDYIKRRLTSGVGGGYDFVDVRDVADGIIACCEKGRAGECYILSNKYYTVREVLHMLHEITGRKEIKSFLPLWFIKLTAPIAELYYKILKQPPLFTPYSIYTINSNASFSHE